MSAEMWDRGAQSEREMQGRREKEDSRVGGLTVDCNNRTHEGALQSETPFSAQTWYASGAVFMQLGKAMRARGFPARNTWVPEDDAMVADYDANVELIVADFGGFW